MGRVKDKLIELEDLGVIKWSDKTNSYVLADIQDPVPFDLAQYLFEKHQRDAEEAQIESTEDAMNELTQENFWS